MAKINTLLPTKILAAGLSTLIDFKIVAPSLVTWTSQFWPVDCKILSFRKQEKRNLCYKMYNSISIITGTMVYEVNWKP